MNVLYVRILYVPKSCSFAWCFNFDQTHDKSSRSGKSTVTRSFFREKIKGN